MEYSSYKLPSKWVTMSGVISLITVFWGPPPRLTVRFFFPGVQQAGQPPRDLTCNICYSRFRPTPKLYRKNPTKALEAKTLHFIHHDGSVISILVTTDFFDWTTLAVTLWVNLVRAVLKDMAVGCFKSQLPCLKLRGSLPLKINGGKMNSPFGMTKYSGAFAVSFRECNTPSPKNKNGTWNWEFSKGISFLSRIQVSRFNVS